MKEWTIYTCSDVDESEKLCAEWKIPDKRDALLYDPIYTDSEKCKVICREESRSLVAQGGMGKAGREGLQQGQGNFGSWWVFHCLECGDGIVCVCVYKWKHLILTWS